MSLPRFEPMLATLWPDPFTDDDWLFEEKVDGFRTLLYWDGTGVQLRSRSGRDTTVFYPELTDFSARRPCVLDGEAVVRDDTGVPRFELMQHRTGVPTPGALEEFPLEFVAFDLLYDDEDITGLPIEDRRRRLEGLVSPFTLSSVSDDGLTVWAAVLERGLEGMVAKRRRSLYSSGRRSEAWRKVPRVQRVKAVVGGFTVGEGGRAATFGSLQVGLWRDGALVWVGSVGTGFTDSMLVAIRQALDQQRSDTSPFHPNADLPQGTQWVEPRLVAMIGIKEWTSYDRMRAPRFLGFTDDDVDSITWQSERLSG